MEEPKQTEQQVPPPVDSEEIQLLKAVEKNTRLTRIRMAWIIGLSIASAVIAGCNEIMNSI